MRVFLTGGTGFIGSHIVAELLAKGHDLTLLTRNPGKIPFFQASPQITLLQGTLDDIDVIRRSLSGHDACIHNALYWEDEPTELQLKDTRASVAVFEAAADAGVSHLVYTSSTAVHRPFRPHMNEDQRLTPTDYYGATKAAAEAFLAAFSHQTNMCGTVIRPGPTVGGPAFPGARVKYDRRFEALHSAAKEGADLVVDRHDGRQFIDARDLATVYASVLDSPQNETYLVVGQDFVTWERIATEIIALTGSQSRLVLKDAGHPPTPPLFDTTKLKERLNLPFHSWPAVHEFLRNLTGP